jgi:hypothetical protein
VEPNGAPNTIACLKIHHTARLAICPLNHRGGINVEGQGGTIQQGIKDPTNVLYGLMIYVEKSLLMKMKRADQVLVKHVKFNLKRHVG